MTTTSRPHTHPDPGYAGRFPAAPGVLGTGTRAAVVRLLAAIEAPCAPCGDRQLLDLDAAQRAAPRARAGAFGQPLGPPGPAEAVYAYLLWATATLLTGHADTVGLTPAECIEQLARETRPATSAPKPPLCATTPSKCGPGSGSARAGCPCRAGRPSVRWTR